MKRELTFIRTAICCECGTGYGTSGPLGVYQEAAETVLLCEECAYNSEDNGESTCTP